jgi:hypothetical protein
VLGGKPSSRQTDCAGDPVLAFSIYLINNSVNGFKVQQLSVVFQGFQLGSTNFVLRISLVSFHLEHCRDYTEGLGDWGRRIFRMFQGFLWKCEYRMGKMTMSH